MPPTQAGTEIGGDGGRGMRILWALAFGAAMALVLLRVPVSQNADGLLETVMSLQRLTLFYWGQSRFANLLPALAAPIRNPVANADAQLAARIVLGLAAPLLVCALLGVRERVRATAHATVLSALLFLACAPPRIITETLIEASPYGTSFTLAGLAMLAFRQAAARSRHVARWRVAGVLLATLAFLENVSLAIEVAPLAGGLCLLVRTRATVEWTLASAFGLLATMTAMKLWGSPGAPQIGGFGRSLAGLRVYGGYLVGPPGHPFWVGLGLAVASHVFGRGTPDARLVRAGDLVLVGTIAVSFVATGLSNWVVLNDIHPRYLVPDYLLAAGLGGMALARIADGAAGRFARAGRLAQEGAGIATAALLLALAAAHVDTRADGESELIGADWRAMSSTVAATIRLRHLDGIAGTYWDAWPAVFRMGASAPPVFGFADRGATRRRAIVRRLRAHGQLRIGCIEAPGVDCLAMTRLAIGVPVRVTAGAEPPLPLSGGRRLTTLVVVPLR